ncbi:hypothetical protein RclHR1_03200007 [Rhizophagus clarus]|uniref:Uncharacterized protein n=1 Tax=Rhizophagus clarus TaxID=94130 RepID=A0A2Z6R7Q5_9GLOM|nr:hypothetical protein RclHR1_03200007 [Rhizophagus clarus]GES97312.1 hypothetical protein GLOIN_2v1848880 [Rhizophagus clarus]
MSTNKWHNSNDKKNNSISSNINVRNNIDKYDIYKKFPNSTEMYYVSDNDETQTFDEEEKKLQDEIHNNINLLYNNLQKKCTDLINKNVDQHQIIVKKLKNEIEEIKGINLKNQSKIESQEQIINQLRQSLGLKENQTRKLGHEKELEAKKNEILNLKNENRTLRDEIDKYKTLCDEYNEKYMELLSKNN